ncbi:type I-E CRISPR-associated protein Cas7/Cse4/CasC [uncultured Microbulbifer sp.]|uniref:type I-E CRISPR-associated protein Cas7/Cse4/CasC n=1 Tax=uncultured Microbulbifer sp. TaxID=348147 RepID=UPI0026128E56|nr:type I-E CRISPR-associated protein Cas7/Cse4/CasC [uncultured Microbulbifer sp.]
MSRFIQLHLLTAYPPANLNRDDLGRPKTAKMGGCDRLRISSQSLKRHWRTSELFQQALGKEIDLLGTRSKRQGIVAYEKLLNLGVAEKKAKQWAQKIAEQFGKLKKPDKNDPSADLEIEQLVHLSVAEQKSIDDLLHTLAKEAREPEKADLDLLRHDNMAVDIALFGRMLAAKPSHNVEAACQVAHALSVHSVVIEDDYFTAVDDLNDRSEDAGAAHLGEAGFAAGLFYSYLCINKEQLIDSLGGDKGLADRAVAALTETALKVSPTGKQNSYASRAYASYALAEAGDQQPRALTAAYLKPVDRDSEDYAQEAINALQKQLQNFDKVYGLCADSRYTLNAVSGDGSLQELLAFVSE